jgi:hypothetical protein
MSFDGLLEDEDLLLLLHDWTVLGEYDGGYVLGRCGVCGQEELLDVVQVPDRIRCRTLR